MDDLLKKGATKHCCYGLCNSDSRYGHRDYMEGVKFIRFPKPWKDKEKCLRWVNACKRDGFTTDKVTKDTYICSKHFIGGKGPTDFHPDPIPATATPNEIGKLGKKRKAPTPRTASGSHKNARKCLQPERKDAQNDAVANNEIVMDNIGETTIESKKDVSLQVSPVTGTATTQTEKHIGLDLQIRIENSVLKNQNILLMSEIEPLKCKLNDQESALQVSPITDNAMTQTEKHIGLDLQIRIENSVLKNQNILLMSEIELLKCKLNDQESGASVSITDDEISVENATVSTFLDINDVKNNPAKFKFYTGLTFPQFMCLWGYLGPSVNKLVYWNQDRDVPDRPPEKRPGPKRKLTPMNELFMTLIRLRHGLLIEDLSYRFDVSKITVSRVVLTWIQFLFIRLSAFRTKMFPDRSQIRKHLPKSFKKYKNIRCIIDCTEFFIQQPRKLGKQGNRYSSYKGHATYKFLVAIAPNGAIVFVSGAFEGSISDNEIVKKSGFLDTLNAGDVIMADRGFEIEDLVISKGAKLVIPPFLGSRDKFTPQEEARTKHRIHVERAIERMKKYRILQKIIPLTLQPVFSQMIFVIACLVNFQNPLVQ